MKELFENKRIVEDFRKDKTNSPSYRWKPLQLSEEYDIWLKYYAGDKLDNKIFNVKDLCKGIQHAYVYFIKQDGESFSYEYDGDVIVDRKTENKIRTDIIDNLDKIEKDIKKQIVEMKNAPE
ncbi:MAG: hypothetical protein IKG90_08020 [Bacteroidales bacterium]|nr:hypothetical protein [Bacteroidales bacterium]MBR6882238.1 hypothetical protein [Bacteroidales bacterium]